MKELIYIAPLVFTRWQILLNCLNIHIEEQAIFVNRYWIP
jgi:hypothetical protein